MKNAETRKALLIGINDYHKSPLNACEKDAKRMRKLLEKHGDGTPNYACKIEYRKDGKGLKASLKSFLKDRTPENAIIYFSGHGYVDEQGEGYLVAKDFTKENIGIRMSWLVQQINVSKIPEITVILDCCHAGSLGVQNPAKRKNSELRENVTILAATEEDDVASERAEHGVFTEIVLNALAGAAADPFGNVTAASIYNLADSRLSPWQQRPVFKSYVTRTSPIRKCYSQQDLISFRALTEYRFFLEKDREIQLSPGILSIDPTQQTRKAEFISLLHRFYRAGFIECSDGMSPFEAAMKNKTCKLSKAGESYREMLQSNQV